MATSTELALPNPPSPHEDPEADPSSAEDDDSLAQFLEAEVLSLDSGASSLPSDDQDGVGEKQAKRFRIENNSGCVKSGETSEPSIKNGNFSKIPPEIFQNILKFLSSEDLVTCAAVCQFLRLAASDECLWRRLYCLRWGLLSAEERSKKPRGSAWKQLYFEHDKADMIEFVRNTPPEFREYYIQMQAAKRSQAPLPSQVKDDLVIVDITVAEQITAWRCCQGLADVYVGNHLCSGRTCTYYQIGDVFLCEKTGRAHVCGDTCRETILDSSNELLVCTISGRCFDRWLSSAEEEAADCEQQLMDNNAVAEEVEEPALGSCRLARAYSLGYNCDDEKELKAALREVIYPGSMNKKGAKSKAVHYKDLYLNCAEDFCWPSLHLP